jgi:hypothetical protein
VCLVRHDRHGERAKLLGAVGRRESLDQVGERLADSRWSWWRPACGGLLVPVSGFWLFFPIACLAWRKHRTRSNARTCVVTAAVTRAARRVSG